MTKPLILIPSPTSTDLAYNRACAPQYAEAVRACGGQVLELEPLTKADVLEQALARVAGILLPGSPADVDPSLYGQERGSETAAADGWRENTDRLLLSGAERTGLPVLAICYGMQSMNVWRGGTLIQDVSRLPVNHAAGPSVAVAHAIEAKPGSLLAQAAETESGPVQSERVARVLVNSSHHQAVGVVGEGLRAVARSPEDGVVEAVEGEPAQLGFPAVAVQWHPERSIGRSPLSRSLFAWLLERAAER